MKTSELIMAEDDEMKEEETKKDENDSLKTKRNERLDYDEK